MPTQMIQVHICHLVHCENLHHHHILHPAKSQGYLHHLQDHLQELLRTYYLQDHLQELLRSLI